MPNQLKSCRDDSPNRLYEKAYMKRIWYYLFLLLTITNFFGDNLSKANAQIIPDNTLGNENSIVTPQQMRDLIEGGAIRGNNLFHSFQEFNVNSGQQVYFANPQEVSNIFSRVTGNNLSQIFGTLGVDGMANLFLINPNGFLFGGGASLDLNGAFVTTTGDRILFADGNSFSATNPQTPPLLTINVPLGIQFNNNVNRGGITVNDATLQVKPRQTLALIGGDVNLSNTNLLAREGNINLVSVLGEAIVNLNDLNSFNIPNDIQKGEIVISDNSLINVMGESGGNININANNFNLTASELRAGIGTGENQEDSQLPPPPPNNADDNLQPPTTNNGNMPPPASENINQNQQQSTSLIDNSSTVVGDINIIVNNDISITENSSIINLVQEEIEIEGGNIFASGENLFLNNSVIRNGTGGLANAGNIVIELSNKFESLYIDENFNPQTQESKGIFSRAGENSRGDAGNISISAPIVNLIGFSTFNTNTRGSGDAGNITVLGDRLKMTRGATLFSTTFAQGNGGDIQITMSESISLGDVIISPEIDSLLPQKISGIVSGVEPIMSEETIEVGDGGNITINTGKVLVQRGSLISTDTRSSGKAGDLLINATEMVEVQGVGRENPNGVRPPSAIFAGSRRNTTGDGGNLTINTKNVRVLDGGEISLSTAGSGDAGTLTINASESIILDGTIENSPSKISSQAGFRSSMSNSRQNRVTGNGGDIYLDANNLILGSGSFISASSTGTGKAGLININVNDTITLQRLDRNGRGSSITTSVSSTAQDAGDITIDTQNLHLSDGALISTSTAGAGNAGKITINAIESITMEGENNSNNPQIRQSFIISQILEGAQGDSEGIEINTGTLTLRQGAEISASTFGIGDSGKVIINAGESVTLQEKNSVGKSSEISSEVEANALGNSQGITINTKNFSMRDSSEIATSTKGKGNAGDINIIATDSFIVRGEGTEIESAVEIDNNDTSIIGEGNSGDINIISDRIEVLDKGRITASTIGFGDGGNISIETKTFNLNDSVIDALTTLSGEAGNISIFATESINVTGTGFGDIENIINFIIGNNIDASNFDFGIVTISTGIGNAGSIYLSTSNLSLSNGGLVSANSLWNGRAGLISINANNEINLNDSALLTATYGNESGGNINLNSSTVNIFQSQTITSTFGSGDAGNINVNATESINLTNRRRENNGISTQGLLAATSNSLTEMGKGGNITLNSPEVNLINGGGVSVTGFGLGDAGEIVINADFLNLEAGGIAATSNSGEGGNVTLNINEQLNLLNGSEITARAGVFLEINQSNVTFNENSGGGNGGNIFIDSPIIIAFPGKINQITANAFTGNGGNIAIATQGIFGSEFLNINASSQLGIDGVIEIYNPNVDPASGLVVNLEKPKDTTNQVVAACSSDQGNTFTVVGKGGLPTNPTEPLSNEIVWEDNRIQNLETEDALTTQTNQVVISSEKPTSKIVPAKGWIIKKDGTIILTPEAVAYNPQSSSISHPHCQLK